MWGSGSWSGQCEGCASFTAYTCHYPTIFDVGRAVRCLLPLGGGNFMHFVVMNTGVSRGYVVSGHKKREVALLRQAKF